MKPQSTYRSKAERALGKPLPAGAEVHHVDGNPRNNASTNLVICQDKAYHRLLHERQRARNFPRSPDAPPSYIIRNIPDDLWRQAKAKAALEGASLKRIIIELVAAWVNAKG